jgi:hypothetical protein
VCPNQPGKPIKLYMKVLKVLPKITFANLIDIFLNLIDIFLNLIDIFLNLRDIFLKKKKITLTLPKISVYDALFFFCCDWAKISSFILLNGLFIVGGYVF